MGHVRNYMLGEVVAHFRRRHGYAVMRPMGYDAFGLPAENAAIKEGRHPREVTERNIASIRRQMERMGWAIDWDRVLATHEPEYYRWTQWLFLRFFERDLAYRKEAPVKWCPNDQTVLANEQVIDGRCERCGAEVEARNLEQWFFRITAYADELLQEMELLESWPERVLIMQRNWIGRSEGADLLFRVEEIDRDIEVFTTRPDTLFGATFFVARSRAPAGARAGARDAARGGGARLCQARRCAHDRRARGEGARRHLHGPLRDQPGRRVPHPDLGRRLRADGVRHRRDHGRARPRPAGLRVRAAVRAARQGRRRAGRGRGRGRRRLRRPHRRRGARQLGAVQRHAEPGGEEGDRRVARAAAARAAGDPLPPARLAAVTAALLGRADPRRPLRRLRDRGSARRGAAGAAARGRGVPAEGPLAAGGGGGLGAHDLPEVRRRSASRDRHDGHVRRLLLVLHPLRGRAQRRRCLGPRDRGLLAAGQPVHRRDRARDPAPAVRALLHEGAERHRPGRLPRAVRAPVHAGDAALPRREDVQVEGECDRPRRLHRALRGRRLPHLPDVHRAGRAGRRVAGRGLRGDGPVPEPALARRHGADGQAGRRRRPTRRWRARRTRRSPR